MLTKDDIETLSLLIARSNGHPAPEDYTQLMLSHFEHMQDVANAKPPELLAGMQVLSDPTEWPAAVVNTDTTV